MESSLSRIWRSKFYLSSASLRLKDSSISEIAEAEVLGAIGACTILAGAYT